MPGGNALDQDDGPPPGRAGIHALSFLNAAIQTGFGPFVSVLLLAQGWSLTEVGFALSIGTVATLALQIPGGLLVDAVHEKRAIAQLGLGLLAASALIIAFTSMVPAIWAAEVLHALASVLVTPAIAALTLSLCGHDSFSERLGGNARYASIGGAVAAAAFGFAASRLGQQSIFFIAAALAIPAAFSVMATSGTCPPEARDHMANVRPDERDTKPWVIFRDPLMHLFAAAVLLFSVANTALVPLTIGRLSAEGRSPDWMVPAMIVGPQVIVALFSPLAGRLIAKLGRRLVLIAGFLAVPARALLFAAAPGPEAVVLFQLLDGVSATVMGLMLPLIAADLTRKTGHLNLAMGSFGLASGLGATFSTAAAGWLSDNMGPHLAFTALAGVGLAGAALLAIGMPETKPVSPARMPMPAE